MPAKREPIEYANASAEVRAVYDDIMATRKTDWVNNFWKVLANDPPTLRRIWDNIKQVMGPGALDPLTKEMLYVAVSASNGCRYCIASHGTAARNKGMSEAQYSELLAIVGLANETTRLVTALEVEVDRQFL
jgi:AhpD family alkylhydroperoxidase